MKIPESNNARLNLRFGADPNLKCKIELSFQGTTIWEKDFSSVPQRWTDERVDLTEKSGATGVLMLKVINQDGEDSARGYIKRLTVEL